ncbi:MAG: FtsW/RodA/SpoVE family cell cycle protein [Phycisphaerales bacterium]
MNPAWMCVGAGAALSFLGIHTIDLGMSTDPAAAELADDARRQLAFLAVAAAAGVGAAIPHPRLIMRLALPAMGAAIVLLLFLLMPGVPSSIVRPINGARAWISVGPARLQPSELAKIAFVLVVARHLRFRAEHRRFAGLLPPALIAFVPIGLIMLQPDLGTVLLFIPALFAMLVAAGARLRHLTLIVLIAALAAPAAYPLLRPHQQARINALIGQIQGEREGERSINYQSVTARKLMGAGGVTGNTDTHSRALLRYNPLPARHNDMIFAVAVTRFGLLGGVGILLLYVTWIAGALACAAMCKEPFGRLVIVGLSAFIAAQVVVNVGMNVGLLPIIGVTLPFLSAGGSSLLTVWIMTGLVFGVAMRRPIPPYRPSFEYADDA